MAIREQSQAHPPVPAKRSDRRRASRHGFGGPVLVRLYLPDVNEFTFSWLHDVSTSGVAFDLLRPLEAGQELLFQLRTAPADRVELEARVVHATHAKGFCRVGCRFAQPMPHDRLRAIVRQLRVEGGGEMA